MVVMPPPVSSAPLPKFVMAGSTPLMRTSEAKGHSHVYAPGAAFDLKFLKRACGRRCRNFKSAALEHDPEKWIPVFGKDHAPTITWSGMTIRRKVITL